MLSPFVGGAFGSALRTWPHVILAAMAAQEVGRPVKIVLTRRQMYYGVGHRPYTIQRVALGAERDGRLVATIHDAIAETSCYEETTPSSCSMPTRCSTTCDNLSTLYRLVRLDINTPTPMRAPGHVERATPWNARWTSSRSSSASTRSSCDCAITPPTPIRPKICRGRASR